MIPTDMLNSNSNIDYESLSVDASETESTFNYEIVYSNIDVKENEGTTLEKHQDNLLYQHRVAVFAPFNSQLLEEGSVF